MRVFLNAEYSPYCILEKQRGYQVIYKTYKSPRAELARRYLKKIHSGTMTDLRVLFQKQLEGMGEGTQGYLFHKYTFIPPIVCRFGVMELQSFAKFGLIRHIVSGGQLFAR